MCLSDEIQARQDFDEKRNARDLNLALTLRNFELGLIWVRTGFFSVINIGLLTAELKLDNKAEGIGFFLVGSVVSVFWVLVERKNSKAHKCYDKKVTDLAKERGWQDFLVHGLGIRRVIFGVCLLMVAVWVVRLVMWAFEQTFDGTWFEVFLWTLIGFVAVWTLVQLGIEIGVSRECGCRVGNNRMKRK